MSIRPGSESTNLKVGDKVKCSREEMSKGTWELYKDRIGTVVSINHQTFPSGNTYVELGVYFGNIPPQRDIRKVEAQSWFRNDELILTEKG